MKTGFFYKVILDLYRATGGATAIEYGLIAAGIALAVATVIFTVGESLVEFFSGIPL